MMINLNLNRLYSWSLLVEILLKVCLLIRLPIAYQVVLIYHAMDAIFSYTRTLHGLELQVCGLGLESCAGADPGRGSLGADEPYPPQRQRNYF